MTDVTYVILACAASAVAGGGIGALIQTIKDDKAIARKNRIIRKLRRQMAEQGASDEPAATPDTNNDWLRETVRFPTVGGDREN